MSILNFFKKFFLSIKGFFFPEEALKEGIVEMDESGNPISVLLYFYSQIPGYCIKNFVLRIGDKEMVMVGDIPASVKITALSETRITADLDVISYGEIISLHDIEISIPDIYVEGSELRYRLTDKSIGLVPITFSATIGESNDEEIDQENKIVIYPDGYKE